MIELRQTLIALSIPLAFVMTAPAEPAWAGKTVRLLTVGNSFSGNATRYLTQIAEAAGHKLVLGRADLPGCSMQRHWEAVEAAEANPADAEGKPYTVQVGDSREHRSLKEILTSEKWDFVTIQQYSAISHNAATYRPYARNLRDYIRKHAPQAEVVIHQTWAYRRDDPRFAADSDSQERMYRQSRNAYCSIARELGLRVIPVGDAFYAADTFGPWRYRPVEFDPAHARYPDLPDQTHSLHVGWYWSVDGNGGRKLAMDGHHANANGCYLAGCVWFEFLFGESVEDNNFTPSEVTVEDARVLRYIAHRSYRNAP